MGTIGEIADLIKLLLRIFDKRQQKEIGLDELMNKEYFVLKIKVDNEKFVGYIWPSDNWVEVHCFKKHRYEVKEYDVDFRYVPIGIGGIGNKYKNYDECSRIKSKWAIFDIRVLSFIISRDKVIGDKKRIVCNPTKKDFERWHEWHPEDDYLPEIWMEDLVCSWTDSHLGCGSFVHHLDLKTLKEKMCEE